MVVEVGTIIASFPLEPGQPIRRRPLNSVLFFAAATVGAATIRAGTPESLSAFNAHASRRSSYRPISSFTVQGGKQRWCGSPCQEGGCSVSAGLPGKCVLSRPGRPELALSRSLSMQVMPWIRHACGNRLDCVFLSRKGIEAMNADAGGTGFPSSAAVLSLPEPRGPMIRPAQVRRMSPCRRIALFIPFILPEHAAPARFATGLPPWR